MSNRSNPRGNILKRSLFSMEQKGNSESLISSNKEKPKIKPEGFEDLDKGMAQAIIPFNFKMDNDCDQIINLLKKSIRANKELEILSKTLMEIPFFCQILEYMDKSGFISLIKKLKYEKYHIGEMIFQDGDIGTKSFILIKGGAYELIKKNEIIIDNNKEREHTDITTKNTQSDEYDQKSESFQIHVNQHKFQGNSQTISFNNNKHNIHIASDSLLNPELKLPILIRRSFTMSKNIDKSLITPILPLNDVSHLNALNILSPTQGNQTGKSNIYFRRSSYRTVDNKSFRSDIGGEQSISQDKNSNFSSSVIEKKFDDPNFNMENYIEYQYPNYKIVKKLEPGQSFGESVFFNNSVRKSSIICKDECFVASLSKDAYEKTIKEYDYKLYQNKIHFLKDLSLFSEWSQTKLAVLVKLFETKSFSKDAIIYNKGDKVNYFYLINSGEVEIRKSIKLNDNYYQTKNTLTSKETSTTKSILTKNFGTQQKEIIIAKLGPGNYFGEDEIIQNEEFREYKAVCITNENEFYVIEKDKFLENVKYSNTLEIMTKNFIAKREWREQYTGNIKENIQKIVPQTLSHSNSHTVTNTKVILPMVSHSNSQVVSARNSAKNSDKKQQNDEILDQETYAKIGLYHYVASRMNKNKDLSKVISMKNPTNEHINPRKMLSHHSIDNLENLKFFPKGDKSNHFDHKNFSSVSVSYDFPYHGLRMNTNDLMLIMDDQAKIKPSAINNTPPARNTLDSIQKSDDISLNYISKPNPKKNINEQHILEGTQTIETNSFKQICIALGLNKIQERSPIFDSKDNIEDIIDETKKVSKYNFHAFTPEDALIDDIALTPKLANSNRNEKEVVNIHTQKSKLPNEYKKYGILSRKLKPISMSVLNPASGKF